ncbi:nitroreductase family protein [Acholeplasma granularum]|uniref:nitroreductase family protein n=1 Tax=Acholeplasma granularum TaxID=264635 RepID=UPI00046ED0C5|nr:nitroreductase family protein [Acholeplasma granularum]
MKDTILGRRSIRRYTDYKISRNQLDEILNDALRAPSSRNLQPVRLFVIESQSAKEKLRPTLFGNQLQLDTASQLILVTADTKKYEEAHIIFDRSVELGKMPHEVRTRNLESFKNVNADPNDTAFLNSLNLDAGLFSMNLMLVARMYGYDTCAIGGFDKKSINDALNIDKRYVPVLIISIGKADESGYDSIRLRADEVTKFID